MTLRPVATHAPAADAYPFPLVRAELDFRPLLQSLINDKQRGRDQCEIARAFQCGVASGLCDAAVALCHAHNTDTIVLSGGVFQNELLLRDLKDLLEPEQLQIWTNHVVPSNDGGISLGQAALAALGRRSPQSSDAETESESESEWTAQVT